MTTDSRIDCPLKLCKKNHMRKPRMFSRMLCWLVIATCTYRSIAEETHRWVEGEVLVVWKQTLTPPSTIRSSTPSPLTRRPFAQLSASCGKTIELVCDHERSTAELITQFSADPQVESVEPNYLRRHALVAPNDSGFASLWGLNNTGQTVNTISGSNGADIRFVHAWNLSRRSTTNIVVAVVDSGVDIGHPDLAANIWTNVREIPGNQIDDDLNGYVDDINGYDFLENTANVLDSGSHGTHIAGTIAAVARNGIGIVGVQPEAKVMALKVSRDGITMPTAAVIAAFDYVLAQKQAGEPIAAINASFGGEDYSTAELQALHALRDANIIVCAAAGNNASNNDATLYYPSCYASSNIISVAAITQSNTLSSFSNYGANQVDIAAPGSNIRSTKPLADIAKSTSLSVNGNSIVCAELIYSGMSPANGITGNLIPCGVGGPNDFPHTVNGAVALIERGGNLLFREKLRNAMNAGALAAVIYDNTNAAISDPPPWTLLYNDQWIPVLRITQASGQALLSGSTPRIATLINYGNPTTAYQYYNGTSMATPHVTGAIAFAALNFPTESMSQRINRVLTHVTPLPQLTGLVQTSGALNLWKIVDTDLDQMPDWWEIEQFSTLTRNSADDADGDHFTNQAEYFANTHPLQANDHLTMQTEPQANNSAHFQLRFSSAAERIYRIEHSASLQENSWQPLGAPIIGTGAPIIITDPEARTQSSQRFYRLILEYP